MKISNNVKNFFMKLWATPNVPKELKELIDVDVDTFDCDITDRVLARQISLDGSWGSYELSDIDIFYDDQAIKIGERLEMFGIRDMAPTIRGGDAGIIIVYRFTMYDVYNRVMDVVTGFRVTIKRKNDAMNTRRIVVYG